MNLFLNLLPAAGGTNSATEKVKDDEDNLLRGNDTVFLALTIQ